MAKFEYAKGRIIESLQFISDEMKEFDTKYADKTWEEYEKDRELQKIMERTVENILTALIEISGSLLTQEGIAVENYAEVMQKCANLFGLTDEEQQNMAQLAIARNRLVHRYLNLKWQVINMYKTNCPLIERLLTSILKREENKQKE
ncbi:MAG: HepT-like ribonuclease domain-containing protein [bacterium]